MARRKAVFTTRSDFEMGRTNETEFNPYIYFDGENLPNAKPEIDTGSTQEISWVNGTPKTVEGVVGKATEFNGESLHYRNWGFPPVEKATLSMWVNFDPKDIEDTGSNWKILATNRFDGWASRLIHLATYNGSLNIRLYGAGASSNSLDLYSSGSTSETKKFKFEPNTWYHIAVVIDTSRSLDKLVVLVNSEPIIEANFTFNFQMDFKNSFVIGDMYDGNGYPMNGTKIDEVIYLLNENSWSVEQAKEYFYQIGNGESIDFHSADGSIRLTKGLEGLYPTSVPVPWFSPTIDLGGQGEFADYGYIEADSQIPSSTTKLSYFTRSSSDGKTWEEWQEVNIDGLIQSSNLRYLQVRVDFETSDGYLTPQLDELRVLEADIEEPIPDLPNTKVKSNAPLYMYRDLEDGLDSLGMVNNAYDLIIEEEINGEDKLTFKLPVNDIKRKELGDEPVELIANIAERYYIVKEVLDRRDESGKLFTEFSCEARWTELRDWYVDGIEVVGVSPRTALQTIVDNIFREKDDPEFDWTIGHVEIEKRRTLRSEWKDVLSLVRDVAETWGGEILFDTKNKVIHFLEKIGTDSGVRFMFEKNLQNIERIVDTYDLVTRIYPTGKGELDITTVNDGVPYVENRKWVDKLKLRRKIIPYKWKDERYTVPENLKEDGERMLEEMSKPNVAYITTVHDLSTLTGHEHESFDLGDIVTAVDLDLFGEEIVNRIMRRKQNVRLPENTIVEIAQPQKTLADIQSRAIDDRIDTLIESDPLSATDIQEMTVFNNLLNSRGDDGFSSWVHTPNGTKFELENVGFSGSWSYKVEPNYDVDAQMTQTVEGISHRSTYTVSAAVASEGEITRGSSDDAFIGIKVLVYYEGETQPEVHYLAIPDITDQGG